jgi:hypothetical protein
MHRLSAMSSASPCCCQSLQWISVMCCSEICRARFPLHPPFPALLVTNVLVADVLTPMSSMSSGIRMATPQCLSLQMGSLPAICRRFGTYRRKASPPPQTPARPSMPMGDDVDPISPTTQLRIQLVPLADLRRCCTEILQGASRTRDSQRIL